MEKCGSLTCFTKRIGFKNMHPLYASFPKADQNRNCYLKQAGFPDCRIPPSSQIHRHKNKVFNKERIVPVEIYLKGFNLQSVFNEFLISFQNLITND